MRNNFKYLFFYFPFGSGEGFCDTAELLQLSGQVKAEYIHESFARDSIYTIAYGNEASTTLGDIRLNAAVAKENWLWEGAYQFVTLHSDVFGENLLFDKGGGGDRKRFFNFYHRIQSSSESTTYQRLDRLLLTYTSDEYVLKVGRQALSWGNGMLFNPMDFFNPFDPMAVTKEYKTGDDMLYAQRLFDNGNDLQFVWAVRRDEEGELAQKVNSLATKYHGFLGDIEYDILVAEHYDQQKAGLGGVLNIYGMLMRTDLLLTKTPSHYFTTGVVNLAYSWRMLGKNVNGFVELFHNDLGMAEHKLYSEKLLAQKTLINQLQRGELYTIGRDYLALSMVVEVSPLWSVAPTIYQNLQDNSLLLQLTASNSLAQDWFLTFGLSYFNGASGSEFGGIKSEFPGYDYSRTNVFSIDLFWYF